MKSKMLKSLSLLIGMILVSGCVYMPPHRHVKSIEPDTLKMQKCELVGQVYGSGGYPYLAMGLALAEDRAKKQAAKIGATHILWIDKDSQVQPYVLGKAYRCKIPETN